MRAVPSHDRVLRGVVGLPEDARGVHRGEAVDQLTHRGRERLVREVLVGPHRVAARDGQVIICSTEQIGATG